MTPEVYKNFFYSFLFTNFLAELFSLIFGSYKVAINLEISAICVLLIAIGNYKSYKSFIEKEAQTQLEIENKQINKKSKKIGIKKLKSFVSLFRLLGYIFLIFSFFVLSKFQIISPVGFMLGALVVPISTLIGMKISAKL